MSVGSVSVSGRQGRGSPNSVEKITLEMIWNAVKIRVVRTYVISSNTYEDFVFRLFLFFFNEKMKKYTSKYDRPCWCMKYKQVHSNPWILWLLLTKK